MDKDLFKQFEKSFLMSKKFVAFFLTLVSFTGMNMYIIFKTANAGDIGMGTTTVLSVNSVCIAFVSLAFNVKQAALDSAVRLASILGDKFSPEKLRGILDK